jgi:hypothetical protein
VDRTIVLMASAMWCNEQAIQAGFKANVPATEDGGFGQATDHYR